MLNLGKFFDIIIKGGITFLVIFTPLAFGTVEVWSFSVMQIVIFTVFASWIAKKIWCTSKVAIVKNGVFKKKQQEYFKTIPFYCRPGLIMFLLRALSLGQFPHIEKEKEEYYNYYIIGGRKIVNTGLEKIIIIVLMFIALQIIPLPQNVIKFVSPGTYDFYSQYLPGYSEGNIDFSDYLSVFSENPDNPRFSSLRTISHDPLSSFNFLLKLVSYLMVFVVALNEFRDEKSRKYFIYLFAFMGLFVAMEGLLQYYHDNSRLLMFRPRPMHDAGAPFGPFVNRNHFAGYVEMIFPITMAMMFELFLRKKEKRTGTYGVSFQSKTGKMVYQYEQKFTEFYSMAFMGFYALLVMVGGIIIAQSKAGIIITACSMTAIFVYRKMKRALLFLFLLIVLAGAVFFLFSDKANLDAKYEKVMISSIKPRATAWESAIDIFMDFPVLGTGVGSYKVVNSRYTSVGAPWKFYEAHNDFLEILATGGILIFIPFLLAIMFVAGEGFRFIRFGVRKNIYQVAFLISIGALILHETVDFNLQIGSNAFLFSLITGLLMGSAELRETS